MNPKTPTSPGAVVLRETHDLVSLRRRTRAVAEQFGLEERRVRSLSAAAYEAARLAVNYAGAADAHISVTPEAEIQIDVRIALDESMKPREALRQQIASIAPLVDRLAVDESAESFVVKILLSNVPAPRPSEGAAPDAGSLPAAADARAEPGEEHASLQRTVRALQAELDDTNRGVVALYAEIDAQAQMLRQAEDRFRVLLDSVHDYAICMLTSDGEIASWNSGAERLFGYTADEIIGRDFACFYTPDDRDRGVPAEHLRRAAESGRFECEGRRVRRGGSAFDADVLLTEMRSAGRSCGLSLVVRDVTERKRLEDDLRRRAEELAAANRAKEDFLATLSHELRTPLNAMLGWTRLLRMGKLDGAANARALEVIERNAHIQEQLIADILDVSRIVTGKLRVELRPIDLEPIVDASLDSLRPAAEAKGVRMVAQLSRTGAVMGDPDRLQQVIWNLLANAIKFTPSGGQVTVTLGRVGANGVITVSDSGEGIDAALLPFIFDRFTQGDASVTRPHGGLGLGLSIVRHIVELHGGRVQASSEGAGRGSTFSVSLPVRAGQHPCDTQEGRRAGDGGQEDRRAGDDRQEDRRTGDDKQEDRRIGAICYDIAPRQR